MPTLQRITIVDGPLQSPLSLPIAAPLPTRLLLPENGWPMQPAARPGSPTLSYNYLVYARDAVGATTSGDTNYRFSLYRPSALMQMCANGHAPALVMYPGPNDTWICKDCHAAGGSPAQTSPTLTELRLAVAHADISQTPDVMRFVAGIVHGPEQAPRDAGEHDLLLYAGDGGRDERLLAFMSASSEGTPVHRWILVFYNRETGEPHPIPGLLITMPGVQSHGFFWHDTRWWIDDEVSPKAALVRFNRKAR
jgi:hypothetical protein